MRQIIENIIALSEEYQRKSAIHKDEHGIEGAVSLGSQKLDQYLKATQFLSSKMKVYLAELSERQLRNLETLIYFGRGDEDDLVWLHAHLKSVSPTREDVVRTIIEKIPALSRYLQSALSSAHRLGMDIDNLLE